MSNNYLSLDSTPTSYEQIKNLLKNDQPIEVSSTAHEVIEKCRQYLDNKLENSDELFYGINTGFGYLQDVKISNEDIEQLQYNLLMSHACGMGEEDRHRQCGEVATLLSLVA